MKLKKISREKHLDHMVKVVPLIVLAYAVQCYFIMKVETIAFTTNALIFMGFSLISMIACFVLYDLKHQVTFSEKSLLIEFPPFAYKKEVSYSDIELVQVADENETFSTITLICSNGKKYRFYFVDEAGKIKAWLISQQTIEFSQAA